MDGKRAFRNGYTVEESYVEQTDFEDKDFPDHIYKLSKALHILKQAPKVGMIGFQTFQITNTILHGQENSTIKILLKSET